MGCRGTYDSANSLGAKTRSGPFHANMIESWLTNDPGLIIVTPSNPQDAYDLLIESHHLPDPVVYLEHIGLYGLRGGITGWGKSINQIVDTEAVMNRLENGDSSIGKARVVRGAQISQLSPGVPWYTLLLMQQRVCRIGGLKSKL